MKRSFVLGALLVVAALSMRLVAAQQPAANAPKIVGVEKLKDNFYLLTGAGGGGNTAVYIGRQESRCGRQESAGAHRFSRKSKVSPQAVTL